MNDLCRPDIRMIYNLVLPNKVDTSNIKAKNDYDGKPLYYYRDLNFSLDQDRIVNLLMGTSLYGNSAVTLRELLQNSIDACRVRGLFEKKWGNHYEPQIEIRLVSSNDGDYLEVEDNGVGMDEFIISNFFAKVGVSYYKSNSFYKKLFDLAEDYKPISKFGIGILSVFMVADSIEVSTRRVLDKFDFADSINLIIEGLCNFFYFKEGHRREPGTKIILRLKKEHGIPSDPKKLSAFIEEMVNYLEIPVKVNDCNINVNRKSDYEIQRWKSRHYNQIKTYSSDVCEIDGISGKISVALLEEKGGFIPNVLLSTNTIEINGFETELEDKLCININSIENISESVDMDGSKNSGYSMAIVTSGKVYINGVFVSDELFKDPSTWGRSISRNSNKMKWPFPIYYDLNLTNNYELSLNASRDQIIIDEKWNAFEKRFTEIVLTNILGQFSNPRKVASFLKVYNDKDNQLYNEILEIAVDKRLKELKKE